MLCIKYFLCHVLMSNLYVEININVKFIFHGWESERVKVYEVARENHGGNIGGCVKTSLIEFYRHLLRNPNDA